MLIVIFSKVAPITDNNMQFEHVLIDIFMLKWKTLVKL